MNPLFFEYNDNLVLQLCLKINHNLAAVCSTVLKKKANVILFCQVGLYVKKSVTGVLQTYDVWFKYL